MGHVDQWMELCDFDLLLQTLLLVTVELIIKSMKLAVLSVRLVICLAGEAGRLVLVGAAE